MLHRLIFLDFLKNEVIMNDIEIKFYSHLGKLSTLFSRLEYLIREITGLYIVKESHEDMVYLTIIGKNRKKYSFTKGANLYK
jgi:hypothetical protein